ENVGEFAAFFCRTFATSIVIKSDENVVEFSGRGAGNLSEMLAGCMEHGLRVCREGWKVTLDTEKGSLIVEGAPVKCGATVAAC
ncbi:unnamed protein product, partial [Pylaiella littoralis]